MQKLEKVIEDMQEALEKFGKKVELIEDDIEAELDAEEATDRAGEVNNQPDDDLW